MPEFNALRPQCRTIIIPCGSLEEHGPHLPLGTDTFHALELARRVAQCRQVFVAPPLFYGICRSTRDHPGTISISGDTLRALILDLGREFHRQGLRNLIYLSGHAGEVETALMLAAYPHLVSGRPPAEWPNFPKYLLVRDKNRYWPGGVWGDPQAATPEQGETILQAETQRLSAVIDLLLNHPPSFS